VSKLPHPMKTLNKNLLAYLQLASAMAMVGSAVVVGKIIVASFPVFLASGFRFVVALAVLLPWLLRREGGFPRLSRRDWIILFWQSTAGTFLFSIFLLYGLKYTTAAESGIITSTTPAVVGLISFLFLKEKLTGANIMALVLAVLGIMTLNLAGTEAADLRGPQPWLGNLLVFGAVLGEALFITLGKVLSARHSALTISTLISLLGLLMFLGPAVYEGLFFDFSSLSPIDWLPILYYGLVVTVAAFVLWYSGLAKVPAGTAAVFTGVWPVSAVLLSYIVLKETCLWSHLVGLACVLAAIGLITRVKPKDVDQNMDKETKV